MKGMSLLPCAAVMLMSGIAISDVHAQSTGGNALFAYPTRGQTPEQQAADRAACHEWAVAQTGHDPRLYLQRSKLECQRGTIANVRGGWARPLQAQSPEPGECQRYAV